METVHLDLVLLIYTFHFLQNGMTAVSQVSSAWHNLNRYSVIIVSVDL